MTQQKWSIEKIRSEALRYDDLKAFRLGCEGAYNAARRNGVLDEVCAHMRRVKNKRYTEQNVIEFAKTCTTTNEFLKNRGMVDFARRNGIYEQVTSHMTRLTSADNRKSVVKKRIWSHEKVMEIALNYDTVGDFRKSEPRAYDAAHRMKIIKDVTSHMTSEIKRFSHGEYESAIASRNIEPLSEATRCDSKIMHKCMICNMEWVASPWRVINEKTGCPKCAKGNVSNSEHDFIERIKSIGVTVKQGDRSLISPYELDAFIPESSLAVEFNGIYWHSIKDPNYHTMKTEMCENKNVRLIHVWEHEKENEIMFSIIRCAVGSFDVILGARKCSVEHVSWNDAKTFMNENHIQGCGMRTNNNVALVYKGEIVAMMTFGSPRFKPITHDWELVRYTVAKGFCIKGGAARLWSRRPSGSIVTYSDRRLFDGKMYERLGFKSERKSKPGYFYVSRDGRVVLKRYDTRRDKLPALLGDKFDPSLSEVKNMLACGYYRLFDCGTVTWSYRP